MIVLEKSLEDYEFEVFFPTARQIRQKLGKHFLKSFQKKRQNEIIWSEKQHYLERNRS